MLIVSQDKDEIVNFNNIINIQMTDCDGDYVISAIALVGVDDFYRELGYYKTEKRAKEVLQEIIIRYKNWENLKAGQPTRLCLPVYEMPRE